MKHTLASAIVMLAVAGVVIAPDASAHPVDQVTCVRNIVNARVAQLGASVPWSVGVASPGHQATTYSDEVVVSRETPCDYDFVISIVNHEWVHTQQHVLAGHKLLRKVYGTPERVEKVADCGSQLLGSRYTPYIDRWGPCTTSELTDARNLVELPANNRV